jgi:hypothetical protein
MTRRHFNALAALVASYAIPNGSGSVGVEKLASDLADLCARENGRFDRERFLAACLPQHQGCDDWCPYYGETPHHAPRAS